MTFLACSFKSYDKKQPWYLCTKAVDEHIWFSVSRTVVKWWSAAGADRCLFAENDEATTGVESLNNSHTVLL